MGKVSQINNKYSFILRDTIRQIFPHLFTHYRKYDVEHYLTYIDYVLTQCSSWKSLYFTFSRLNDNAKTKDKFKKNHWKTIENFYNMLSKANVFAIAFDTMMENYNFHIKNLNKSVLPLFVDSTIIFNKHGKEKDMKKYHSYHKKCATKVNILTDENKVILSNHIFENPNKHDLEAINPLINKLKITHPNIRIYGDKAYINKRRFFIKNRQIYVVAPKRKNQKTKNLPYDVEQLKKRNKIEHVNASIKRFTRINLRYESSTINFQSTLLYVCALHNDEIFSKLKLY